ncbi:MAG: hypothetical protein H9W81_02520 [Enterococcus sp.]|nr:hypothetical protein [Enterococcus sp.]
MYIVRGITAILAGIVLLTLSGTPTLTAEATQRQESITVMYDGQTQQNPDFNIERWFDGVEGHQKVDIINGGNETNAVITPGPMSDNSVAYETAVKVSLNSGDILYEGLYSDMNVEVVLPSHSTLPLDMSIKWNPSDAPRSDTAIETLGMYVKPL